MSDARNEMLRAIYGVLVTDVDLDAVLAGDKVFDHVPRGAAHPFVSFGDCRTRRLDGDADGVESHLLEVLVHSRAVGRQEASSIAARIVALLDGATLPLTGFKLDALRVRDTSVAASRDRRAYRVRLRFEATTEIN